MTQQFTDAFDQRDLKTAVDLLSEDVEVIGYVPYRFDGKEVFDKIRFLKSEVL